MKPSGKRSAALRIVTQRIAFVSLPWVAAFIAGFAPASPSLAATVPTRPHAVAAADDSSQSMRQGIKVHGHWTIEVRNPDGTVVKRVEFENGLCPTTGGGNPNGGVTGGDFDFASLLTGGSIMGAWAISLGSPTVPAGTNPGPACGSTGIVPSPAFVLVQSVGISGCSATGGSGASFGNGNNPAGSVICFSTLNTPKQLEGSDSAAPNTSSGGFGVTLAGQFTVPSGSPDTKITAVATTASACISLSPPITTTGVTSISLNCGPGNASNYGPQLTGAYLTGTGTSPAPITVVAGQLVSVSVQISFQ
jgi:hypothetical protein